MQIHQSAEDYLETILMLTQRMGRVRSIDVVNELGYTKASVSIAMKKLRENGYIAVDGEGNLTLLEPGREIAERIYSRHRLLTHFFMQLGVDEKIAAEDKARRDQEQSIANAQADAAHAQSIIEQATEVHDHPEITESLAGSLARDKAEHAETEREVAQLEATEDAVRERTRDSRIKFTGAIVCIVAAILVIIPVWLFASK